MAAEVSQLPDGSKPKGMQDIDFQATSLESVSL